jgi:transposase
VPRGDKRNDTPHGRKPLPEHLPREEIVHPPASSCTCCVGTVLRKVATHRTEVPEYVPSSFKITVRLRAVVSYRLCETIMQALLPSFPIERGRREPGLLAHVMVGKNIDGLPLRRQTEIYEREVVLGRSPVGNS